MRSVYRKKMYKFSIGCCYHELRVKYMTVAIVSPIDYREKTNKLFCNFTKQTQKKSRRQVKKYFFNTCSYKAEFPLKKPYLLT